MSSPLASVGSIKVKLGLLVAVSVLVATVLGITSSRSGLAPWLAIPVTVALALAVTQLLARGMTAPLRAMTEASRRMARGDYAVRVETDATDEVGELARAFNTMATDLATVDAERRALVATVAHELRTPLTGMVAVLENLDDGVVAPEPAALHSALDQARRLGDLVRDLLDLSRYDAGAVRLEPVAVPVADLVRRAVGDAEALGRDVTYAVTLEPTDLVVHGDPTRLHQLLANLLDNASRHASPGGVVSVSVHRVGDRWRLGVANPGGAVPLADRVRAFERFGLLGDATGGGTGLGLAIARSVVDLHGGTVGFVDPPSGASGALVVADLPLDPAVPTGAPMTAVPTAAAPPAVPLPRQVGSPWPSWWPASNDPGNLRALLASLGVGVLAAVLVVGHAQGVGYAAVLLAGGATVWSAAGWRRDGFTLACGALATALVLVLVLRDAIWICVLCVMAASVLCLAGTTGARSLTGLVRTGFAWPLTALHGLPWLGRTLRLARRSDQRVAIARTVLVSLTAILVFGLLFASADALFRSWADAVLPDVHLGDELIGRIFVGVFVACLVLGTAYLALERPDVEARTRAPREPVRHRYEWLVPVLLVDAVFVLFLLAQAAATFGGHDYLRRRTGLTYADYVHQGFGQLTFATLLTLLVVAVAGRAASRETARDRAWLRGAVGLLCVLTLVVVGSALHRVWLYQDAYGLTRLRLTVATFEIWLGLLVVALLVAGDRLRATWLPRLALLSGASLLLVLALLNPDALIAKRNIAAYHQTGRIDMFYLHGLSADAGPVLAETHLAGVTRGDCFAFGGPASDDWTAWNLGRSRARSALAGAPDGLHSVC